MSDGLTHFYGNVVLGCAITGTIWLAQPEYIVPAAIGSIMGLLVTPDFDLDGRSITESALYIIPPLGWLWQQLWFGYALMFRHRGLSHNVLLGTAGRVAWTLFITLIVMIFVFGLLQLFGITFNPIEITKQVAIIMLQPVLLFSWWAQDLLHYALDI